MLTVLFYCFINGIKCTTVKGLDVKLVRVDDKNKVDVFIDGKLFTSYQYPGNIEKPFLYPVICSERFGYNKGFPDRTPQRRAC